LLKHNNGNGLLFHMTQPISRSTIKAIACSKPTISGWFTACDGKRSKANATHRRLMNLVGCG